MTNPEINQPVPKFPNVRVNLGVGRSENPFLVLTSTTRALSVAGVPRETIDDYQIAVLSNPNRELVVTREWVTVV